MKLLPTLIATLLLTPLAALHGAEASKAAVTYKPESWEFAGGGDAFEMALAQAAKSGAKHIILHAGVYFFEKPLVLTGAGSGLTISGAAGEKVTISGGKRLACEWKPFRDGIFLAKIQTDITEIDSLWINGVWQHLARYPNYDPNARYLNGGSADALSPERAARWKNPIGAWVHGLHSAHWGGVDDRIVGVDEQHHIKLEGGWGNNRGTKLSSTDRFVEGIFEELDAPGEWFFDAPAHTLYVMPEKDVDLSTVGVIASRTESLFELRGTAEHPVKNVTLSNLTLTQTSRTFMKTREPLLRSDWMIYRGGAVFMNHTDGCRIENCDFINIGGNGVFVSGANKKALITGCLFADSGANGVCFVGEQKAVRNAFPNFKKRWKLSELDLTPGPRTDDYPMECEVSECLMRNLGMVEKQIAGVDINMARRITVRNCTIHHVPRAAINIGDGCWGGHLIEGCDCYDTVLESADHGSFNSWARDRWWGLDLEKKPWDDKLALLDAIEPNTLRNSRWLCKHGWDIDLDDGSTHYIIENNLCLEGGLKLREGYYRIVRNNLIVRNGFHFHVWPINNHDIVVHNLSTGGYAGNVRLPKDWGAGCDYNFVHHSGEALGPATGMQQASGHDTHSLQGDARFKDADHFDWSIAADSPALQVGFHPFPLDSFGVQIPRLKAQATAAFLAFRERDSARQGGPRDERVRDFLGGKVKNLSAEKGKLGMYAPIGVFVLNVPAPGTGLEQAHVTQDDVILAWDKDDVVDLASLERLAKTTPKPGIVTVWRKHAKLMLWR